MQHIATRMRSVPMLASLLTVLVGNNAWAEQTAPVDMMQFSFTRYDGSIVPLEQYRGKAILIVNTASRCGFKEQYAGLQRLWDDYRDKGLVVIGVPSNDFGGQEPLADGEIKSFCEMTYGVNFPIMRKTQIKGENAHPFYQHVSTQFGFSGAPKWNFHKYLINADGKLVDWFSSMTKPHSSKLISAIEQALPQQETTEEARIPQEMANN